MSKRNRRRSAPTAPQKPKPVLAKFELAQTTGENRKHWEWSDALAARAAISPAVRLVCRKRSRYEADNNSWYAGILRTAVNHIVGTGPRLQVLTGNPQVNARIETAWKSWCRSVRFSDTLRTMVETYWRDGEVFALRAERASRWPMSLDLRVFEADQVSTTLYQSSFNDPFVDDGIRFDPATNELEFHILDFHPGSTNPGARPQDGRWYSAAQVLHLWRAERPGQTRGVPRATPALQTLPIMRRQELATLYSAETAANFAMYLKSTSPAIDPTLSPADFAEIELTRNMLTTLPAGWEIGQVEPRQPGPLYEMFQRQALMSFCRCTNMPYPLAAGTGQNSNFSSLKGDMRNVWQPEVIVEQDRIEADIVDRVFSWFLETMVFAEGVLDGAPQIGLIDRAWVWPPLPDLDPTETSTASSQRLQSGQSTPSREYALRGLDWETEAARAAADYGVSSEQFKAAVFAATFKQPTGPQQPGRPGIPGQSAPPAGEYQTIGQRAFTNNLKRIRQTLDQLAGGEVSRVMAEQVLQSIGLPEQRIAALIADALDGRVDDPELAEVAAA